MDNIHNIGVIWHKCEVKGCNRVTKTKGNLKCHLEAIHDIGKHKCDFCLGNKNSSIQYKDTGGKHKICRDFYNKVTGKHILSRTECKWSDYLVKMIYDESDMIDLV